MKTLTVAFVLHKKIEDYREIKNKLSKVLSTLIEEENAETFLLTDKSFFDYICRETLTDLKRYYPLIKRVYIKALSDKADKEYLLNKYDELFISEKGGEYKSSSKYYHIMVDRCDILITYFDGDYMLLNGKATATKNAVEYALKKNKRIINLAE